MSWFPKHNVWVQAGYNVGQWTEECEEWFKKRMTDIREGGQPFDSGTWRSKLLLSRKATKLVRKMDIAATSFIQAQSLGGSWPGFCWFFLSSWWVIDDIDSYLVFCVSCFFSFFIFIFVLTFIFKGCNSSSNVSWAAKITRYIFLCTHCYIGRK